jgi:aminopeptidase-like protein
LDKNSPYHAEINSTLEKGSMTYGEYIIHGNSGKEFLIATYSCHPSMYNDNISGMLVWAKLLSEMQNTKTNHTYHFFIGPETLGVISLLARKNEEKKHGGKGTFDGAVVINCVGRNEDFVLKRSSMGDSEMDKVAQQTFKEMGINHTEVPFSVNGSDERQLQSPAFRIPTINITRGEYYGSDWYHSSKDVYRDKLSFLSLGDCQINASVEVYHNILMNLDRNSKIYSLSPHCEPMLGKRNLYPTTSGNNEKDNSATIAKWIMHESGNSLIDIAKNTGFSMKEIREVYDRLKEGGLIK